MYAIFKTLTVLFTLVIGGIVVAPGHTQTGTTDRENLHQHCLNHTLSTALAACESLRQLEPHNSQVKDRIAAIKINSLPAELFGSVMAPIKRTQKFPATPPSATSKVADDDVPSQRIVVVTHVPSSTPTPSMRKSDPSRTELPLANAPEALDGRASTQPLKSTHRVFTAPKPVIELSEFYIASNERARATAEESTNTNKIRLMSARQSESNETAVSDLSFEIKVAIGLIIAFAFFVQSVMGFGAGMVAIPMLGLVMDVKDAVTLLLLFQAIGYLLCVRDCRHCRWDIATPLLIGMIVGVPLGTYALVAMPNDWVAPLLGAFILMFLFQSAYFPSFSFVQRESKTQFGIAGTCFGMIHAFTGAGGPVLCMAFAGARFPVAMFRGMMVLLLLACNFPRAMVSAHADLIDSSTMSMTMFCLPFFIAAVVIGNYIKHKVPEARYRRAINVLLLVTATLLLSPVVWQLWEYS